MTHHRLHKFLTVFITATFILTGCINQPTVPTPSPSPEGVSTVTPAKTLETSATIEIAPLPEPRSPDGDLALFYGDYETALSAYKQLSTTDSKELQAAALYGQALTYIKQDDLFQAKPILEILIETYPETHPGKRALFLLGQIELEQEQYQAALQAWQDYLTKQPGNLDAYVYEQIGNIFTQLGQDDQALNAYTNAYLTPSL